MLADDIQAIRQQIEADSFKSEAAVCQGIVLRVLHALSWPTYETQVVIPEYPSQGRRIDFALCHPPGKAIVFIEVKRMGQGEGAERQLFEYAFHLGVPLVILTDGQEWQFFLPAGQGSYSERRVYKLDIVEREVDESVSRFQRYLEYSAVVSGAAMRAAQEDYSNVARHRRIQETLPSAW
ncbi:MAG: type I restriction endonuclease [Candidatus Promineifilaceae bacterium]